MDAVWKKLQYLYYSSYENRVWKVKIVNAKHIGKQIKKYREEKGIKQEKFAESVDLSSNYMSAIERGVKVPKLETFVRIANALSVSSDLLLSDVLDSGYVVKSSILSEGISKLSPQEQQKILHVVETMGKDAQK